MGMSKERKVFVGLFAIAIGGFCLDRMVLAPSAAAAAETPAAASVTSGLAGITDGVSEKVSGTVRAALRDVLSSQIDESFGQQAGSLRFGPAAEWVNAVDLPTPGGDGINLTVTPADAGSARPAQTGSATPGLTMVMPTSSGGIAMIDGVRLRVGQTHPAGFILVAVGDRTATIERDGERTVLSMPMPN